MGLFENISFAVSANICFDSKCMSKSFDVPGDLAFDIEALELLDHVCPCR